MKNVLKKIKSNKNLFLAFIIPFVIASLGFFVCLFYKDSGILSPIYGDLQAQYTSLFTYVKDVFAGENSIIYSFAKGLGGNMISTIAYYLISPLNLLILFVSEANVPFMLLFIIILKISLCGLFMYIFLSNIFNKKSGSTLIFSTCYALSAYLINYHFCIMWLDALYMLPLILLGLNRMIKGNSSLMYILCLAYSIICNYYIGYMLCIFVCIYFLYEIIMNELYKDKKELKKLIIRFIIASLLAGMLCMVVLIPMVKDLNTTARSIGNYEGIYTLDTVNNNFYYFNLFYRFLIGSHNADAVAEYTSINAYCGIIILPLLYFYFINKNITKKEKIFSGGIIVLYLLSYSIKYIDYAWHGFAFPNGLNYRFAFLFIFYFIMMAFKSFINIKNIKKIHYLIFLMIFIILSAGTILFLDSRDTLLSIYVSLGCLILYLFLLYSLGSAKTKTQKLEVKAILLLLVVSELFFNIYICLNTYFGTTALEYKEFVNVYGEQVDKYKSDETDFYRISLDDNLNDNNGLLFNYYDIESFLSTNNTRSLNFLKINGYFANQISSIYDATDNVLMDSVLGIKYFITNDSCKNYDEVDTFEYSAHTGLYYGTVKTDKHICLNSNALSIGYMISDNWTTYGTDLENISFLDINSSIVNSMINEKREYYTKYEHEDLGNYQYKVKLDDSNYFYITTMFMVDMSDSKIYINDEYIGRLDSYPSNVILVENKYKNEEIIIRFEIAQTYEEEIKPGIVQFFSQNIDVINQTVQDLKQNELEIEYFSNTYIKGKVTATEEKNTLLFSIPYEDGWEIYVDGKKTSYECIYDAFVGIELTPGEHEIELKYSVPGLKLGASISGITLVLTILYLWVEQKKRKESQNMLEK